jgi:hypothetical protein
MERELKDRLGRAKRALSDPEKVAKIAVAALGSPTRAYNLVRQSLGDKQLAEDWSNLLGLRRDQDKFGITFEEVLSSLFSWREQEKLPETREEKEMGEKIRFMAISKEALIQPHSDNRVRTDLFFEDFDGAMATLTTLLLQLKECWIGKRFSVHPTNEALFRKSLIQILEEKYGLELFIEMLEKRE